MERWPRHQPRPPWKGVLQEIWQEGTGLAGTGRISSLMDLSSCALSFDFFGIEVEVATADPDCKALLAGNYGSFATRAQSPALTYSVNKCGDGAFEISRGAEYSLLASDDGDLLFQLEKEITIEIQKLRPDLYFLHAAVLEYHGLGLMLVAQSGGGKSTTAWALSHHGFRYLSDELAPINLKTMQVLPYPHALGLKNLPPSSYSLPPETIYTSRTFHVPVEALPGGEQTAPTCLAAVFFVSYRPEQKLPCAIPISRAEAAVRLFANALNPLAHPSEGLDGVLEIAARCSSFELVTSDLPQTCTVVKETMASLRSSIS